MHFSLWVASSFHSNHGRWFLTIICMMTWSVYLEKISVSNKGCGKNVGPFYSQNRLFCFWGTFCSSICLYVQSFSELFLCEKDYSQFVIFRKRAHKTFCEGKACITLPPCPQDYLRLHILYIQPSYSASVFIRKKVRGTFGLFSLMSWYRDLFIDNDFQTSNIGTCLSWTVWFLPASVLCFPHLWRAFLISCV